MDSRAFRYSKAWRFTVDIFLPNRCAFCRRVIPWDGLVCEGCRDRLPLADKMSKKLDEVKGVYSALYYEKEVVGLIHRLKDTGEVNNFAELCADIVAEKLRDNGVDQELHLVTSVPMYRKKALRRGYNQAALFADMLAWRLRLPTDHELLSRSADRTEQHKLSSVHRYSHAMEIYSLDQEHRDIRGKTVLICDDVLTTGSTMSVCAQLLREAGAEAVYCCSCAATKYKKDGEDGDGQDDG